MLVTKKGAVPSAHTSYLLHKRNATARGVSFELTFDEWLKWWEDNLGPDWKAKRGCRIGKYVMARHGDVGPYSLSNIKCILHEDNIRERHEVITLDMAIDIYTSYDTYKDLMSKYGISFGVISDVRNRKRSKWRSILDDHFAKSQTHGRTDY